MLQIARLKFLSDYTLIITEKPDSAARIALALDDNGKPQKLLENYVPYYVADRNVKIVVVPALGHLYTVGGEKKGRDYPVFDYKWIPLYMADRKAKRTLVWLSIIMKLAKNAKDFIDACDFDIEGSIIGYNVLKYACGGAEKNAKRMKYSTLTKEEIEKSYAEALPNLDFRLINAGLARHEVDWLYGINLSRALTTAARKASGQYSTLSTGRVQGPTLRFLVERERSIKSFVPTPFWSAKAKVIFGGKIFEVNYDKDSIVTKEEAETVVKKCRGKNATIEKLVEKKLLKLPPPPFDLSSLQNEAYRLFRYTPMTTSSIAQRLYLDALISYPRTSSQKLPVVIGYKEILKKLMRDRDLARFAAKLLAKPELKPREGKGYDPAHPAIYPTGNLPERTLNSAETKIWNLVVKRFFAVFGNPAVQKSLRLVINVEGHKFIFVAKETLEEGWTSFYEPYEQVENEDVPLVAEGTEVKVQRVVLREEFTKPLPRYNPASLLKKMQTEKIGTKATRAGIIQTLYHRKYIFGEKMTVTDLGFEIIDVLEKHCPTVVSSQLTRKIEEKMEKIIQGTKTKHAVVNEAIKILKPITEMLKTKETEVGVQLSQIIRKAKLEERFIGACPACKNGKLVISRSKKTGKRFIGCTGYFEGNCKSSYPIPQRGTVKPQGVCKVCGWPTVRVLMKRAYSWTLCFNPDCTSKIRRPLKT